MLYQLSYFRNYVYIKNLQTNKDSNHYQGWFAFSFSTRCGQRWIRTTEVERQQIYSLPHLATLEFALIFVTISENAFATTLLSQHPNNVGASCRIRTNDPEITNHVLWPTELKRQRLFVCRYCRKASAKVGLFF